MIEKLIKAIIQETKWNRLIWFKLEDSIGAELDNSNNRLGLKNGLEKEVRLHVRLKSGIYCTGERNYALTIKNESLSYFETISEKYAPLKKFGEEMFVD